MSDEHKTPTLQRCGATVKTEEGYTAECGRHEGHDGAHSDLSIPTMIGYRWENND